MPYCEQRNNLSLMAKAFIKAWNFSYGPSSHLWKQKKGVSDRPASVDFLLSMISRRPSPEQLLVARSFLKTHLGTQQSSPFSTNFHLWSKTLQMVGFANTSRYTQSQEQPVLPQHNFQLNTVPNGTPLANVPSSTIFLLLYLPHRRFATKLVQPSLENVRSDQAFFSTP